MGEEELVGGVHDLLAAEVPDVDADVGRLGSWWVGRLGKRELPAVDVDALGFVRRVEGAIEEAVDEGGLADVALADEDHLDFVEGAAPAGEEVEVGVDDGLGVITFGQDLRGNGEGVLAQVNSSQVGQLADLRWQGRELIAAKI